MLKRGAFEFFFKQKTASAIPSGDWSDGVWTYAKVEEYQTKTESKYEAHRKYIDIQYMIKGEELIGVCDKSDCKTCTAYSDSNDIEFFDCKKEDTWQKLREGDFLVLFPNDAHKPSICISSPNIVKKVVVKISMK